MFARSFLIAAAIVSVGQAKTTTEMNQPRSVYEVITSESTAILRQRLGLPPNTDRKVVIETINIITREEMTAQGIVITKRSLASWSLIKRAALLCGIPVTSQYGDVRDCLNKSGISDSSTENSYLRSLIVVEQMHVLSETLNRPVSDFHQLGASELNKSINTLPEEILP